MARGTHENDAIIRAETNRCKRFPSAGGGDIENQICLIYVVFIVVGVCALEQVKDAFLMVVESEIAVFE